MVDYMTWAYRMAVLCVLQFVMYHITGTIYWAYLVVATGVFGLILIGAAIGSDDRGNKRRS